MKCAAQNDVLRNHRNMVWDAPALRDLGQEAPARWAQILPSATKMGVAQKPLSAAAEAGVKPMSNWQTFAQAVPAAAAVVRCVASA